MALSLSLQHISYHDSGLVGVQGALTVLGALSQNPFCTRITLSHNELGDEGVSTLASGITELRKKGRLISPLKELNLSSNGIRDVGLEAIIKHLLLPSQPPQSQLPTIQELILSNNEISLQTPTANLLSAALSHPSAALVSLSLTSNANIHSHPEGLKAFFRHLEPSSLVQLQLNACMLEPEDARIITEWLSDPSRGGRLSHLELNANSMGADAIGTNRIAKAVYAGLNTSLVRLELAANERPITMINEDEDEVPAPAVRLPEVSPEKDEILVGDTLPFAEVKPLLAAALARNHILSEATKHTALQLLPVARVLLHARAKSLSAKDIRQQVEGMNLNEKGTTAASDASVSRTALPKYTYSNSTSSTYASSPILNIPTEIVLHILRFYTTLDPIPLPPNPSNASNFNPGQIHSPTFASALSDGQFMRILTVAQDRSSLTQAVKPLLAKGTRSSMSKPSLLDSSDIYLRIVGCTAYERRSA